MQGSILLPDEKVISTRKISILVESGLWIGALCIVLSAASYFLLSLFAPAFLTASNILQFVGMSFNNYLGDVPLLPAILLVIGFFYVLYAELKIFFKEYIVTTSRVMVQSGILNKSSNILLPSKIEDVNVGVNILERLFHIGRVIVVMQQDIQKPIILSGIKEPYKFQADILNLVGKRTYTNQNEETPSGTSKTD